MKATKNILMILALGVMTQLTIAQCPGNKILMNEKGYRNGGTRACGCNQKCVPQNQVQHYLTNGWVLGACSAICSLRMEEAKANPSTSLMIYPNPVSNSTTISFSLSQQGKISVQLFDMTGRFIKTLAEKVFEEGENKIEWNVAEQNAGLYFLRIETANYSATEKLIVAKN